MFWLNIALSNLGSFAFGLLVSKWLAHRAAAAVDHIHDHSEVPMPSRRPALMPLPVRVVVLVVVGVLMFGLGVRVGYQLLADKVTCFNVYAEKSADAQNRRSVATQALQDADKDFKAAVATALSPGATRDDFQAVRDAAQESLDKQADLERERRLKPYPDPPSEVC